MENSKHLNMNSLKNILARRKIEFENFVAFSVSITFRQRRCRVQTSHKRRRIHLSSNLWLSPLRSEYNAGKRCSNSQNSLIYERIVKSCKHKYKYKYALDFEMIIFNNMDRNLIELLLKWWFRWIISCAWTRWCPLKRENVRDKNCAIDSLLTSIQAPLIIWMTSSVQCTLTLCGEFKSRRNQRRSIPTNTVNIASFLWAHWTRWMFMLLLWNFFFFNERLIITIKSSWNEWEWMKIMKVLTFH